MIQKHLLWILGNVILTESHKFKVRLAATNKLWVMMRRGRELIVMHNWMSTLARLIILSVILLSSFSVTFCLGKQWFNDKKASHKTKQTSASVSALSLSPFQLHWYQNSLLIRKCWAGVGCWCEQNRWFLPITLLFCLVLFLLLLCEENKSACFGFLFGRCLLFDWLEWSPFGKWGVNCSECMDL